MKKLNMHWFYKSLKEYADDNGISYQTARDRSSAWKIPKLPKGAKFVHPGKAIKALSGEL